MIVAELLTAAHWDGDYDIGRNTVSDLGAATCTTIRAAYGPVDVCSPWHPFMNATFVAIGVALALGGALGALHLPRGVLTWTASGLLVVAGASSVGVGLVPLDRDGALHTMVATPLFATQPMALLILAVALRGRPSYAVALLAAGLVAGVGSIAFGVTLVTGDVGGVWERIGLWSCHLGVAVVGLAVLRSRPRPATQGDT